MTRNLRKRTMHNPEAFVGKRIDVSKWNFNDNTYATCAMTGKFMHQDDLSITFAHYAFPKAFLIANGIYVEDAEWLSEEGYDLIMAKLESLGFYDAYRAWFDTDMQHEIEVNPTKDIDMSISIPTAFYDFIERFLPIDSDYDAAEESGEGDDTTEYIEQGDDVIVLAANGEDYVGTVEDTDAVTQEALVYYFDHDAQVWLLHWWNVGCVVLQSAYDKAMSPVLA